mmetsp:Transcript_25833/g.39594  ORF Transcript_25833/g.39594 Transcript_25833/m.39594 type:complete len:399 (-) Transcript_25833:169-1365(-)|eukprot:CAMPEP_0194073034 /NCGR_PEP_ID=MMETSP0149-20130528/598_1 /TAXON_ID=122233 /ORGANISM="Chaetoceros debilis, Strain MM31A-1" /LENGTH=398 /DNA_ID=CAMNT_0038752989 /DNA_START=47 /DNA_END=1243 /DNA_ORIENTATION=+
MATKEEAPSNANEACVGPESSTAGKASGCDGCPNQNSCASGEFSSPQAQQIKNDEHLNIRNALSNVDHVILVLSGKGGVGKSTVCCQLAHTLSARGYAVGVLDVDICGPSAARMLGCAGKNIHQSASGMTPVPANPNLSVMSIAFMMPDEDAAVVWRGPRKNGLIKKFLTETDWGEEGLDYLLIDTPPGTSDEHISIVQYLQGAIGISDDSPTEKGPQLGGAVMVTTPEEVAMMDVRKELNFCTKTKLPVLGIVENMSKFQTSFRNLSFSTRPTSSTNIDAESGNGNGNGNSQRDADCTSEVMALLEQKCPEVLNMMVTANVFPPSGGGPRGMATRYNVPFLGTIPLDPNLLKSCEDGVCFVQAFPQSPAVASLNSITDQVVKALPVDDGNEDMKMEH